MRTRPAARRAAAGWGGGLVILRTERTAERKGCSPLCPADRLKKPLLLSPHPFSSSAEALNWTTGRPAAVSVGRAGEGKLWPWRQISPFSTLQPSEAPPYTSLGEATGASQAQLSSEKEGAGDVVETWGKPCRNVTETWETETVKPGRPSPESPLGTLLSLSKRILS